MKKSVVILGASGYTGAELLRLINQHPSLDLLGATANSCANECIASVFPHLPEYGKERFSPESEGPTLAAQSDLVFCALPHGESMRLLPSLEAKRIVDLGGDFRLTSAAAYATWYGITHSAPSELGGWLYGLSELFRDDIKEASRVANPGCYATAIILAAAPLVSAGLVSSTITVSAMSGLSGAGKSPKSALHFPHAFEDTRAYKVATHQHIPEIEQTLSKLSKGNVKVILTPHLVPMSRGIHATLLFDAPSNMSQEKLKDLYEDAYRDETFVRISPQAPGTKDVRGSNSALLFPTYDARTSKIVVTSVIDNLIKGAAGQALQNANLMLGLEETAGLSAGGLYP